MTGVVGQRGAQQPGGGETLALTPAAAGGRGGSAGTRTALGQVEADRDDTIAYLSTIRVVMEVVERAHSFEQVCQQIAETLVEQIGAETCALAVRERPEEPFRLRGFATQSQRIGDLEPRPPVNESTWLTAATLMAASGQVTCYRREADGALIATADACAGEGILGLPCGIGGEPNGVIILEYVTAPGQQFARCPALGLVADIIGGAITTARTRDAMARVLAELQREVGVTRDALSQREDTLREREDNVEMLTQALVESNQVKREFLGTLSHELRTPLNAILGYSELLHDGMVGPLADEQTTLLERMMVSARHLNQLIDDMLFFVQLEARQAAVHRETFSLGDLVREITAALPDRARSKAVFRVEIAPGAERVSCDRALLKRTVFHLLANGFKFTQTGEVSVTATSWDAGDGVAIVVRDTGIGIAGERLEEIFEAFRQLDMSNTRRFSGLGLGLALVRRCVRILGGEIAVRSAVGEGSEFTVKLPATLPGQATTQA